MPIAHAAAMPPVGSARSKKSRPAGIAKTIRKPSAISAQSAPTTSRRLPGSSSSTITIASPDAVTVATVTVRASIRFASKPWRASR